MNKIEDIELKPIKIKSVVLHFENIAIAPMVIELDKLSNDSLEGLKSIMKDNFKNL